MRLQLEADEESASLGALEAAHCQIRSFRPLPGKKTNPDDRRQKRGRARESERGVLGGVGKEGGGEKESSVGERGRVDRDWGWETSRAE